MVILLSIISWTNQESGTFLTSLMSMNSSKISTPSFGSKETSVANKSKSKTSIAIVYCSKTSVVVIDDS